MTSTGNGDICAMSAGRMWLLKHGEKKFRRTLKLSHYGFGDQGLRNDGLLDAGDSSLFIGEYYQNPNRGNVNLLKSKSNLMGWMPAYEFQPGQIRHIHAIQKDPYSEKLWICTGDSDKESMIGWSDDDFKTIRMIGQGSQLWRVCQLVFTQESILWGTDTDSEELGGIYKWNKKTGELKKCISIDGAIFYGTQLKNGTIVMSTNRQGLSNEKDDKVRLYIISEEGHVKAIECGTWNHKKPGFWFKHALLRLQRNQGGSSLGITCLNQKEFAESELVIISEESLHSVLDASKSTSGKPL
jgi:hypothetical protein